MHELCHRCHGELPALLSGQSPNGDDALLFCPRCSAPQLRLPEHMWIEGAAAGATSGTMPPPRIGAGQNGAALSGVDWRSALRAAAIVALASAIFAILSLRFSFVSLPSFLCTVGGAVIALGIYTRARPDAAMDGRLGLRIGAATGLLMVTALAVGLALTGVFLRFATRSGMAEVDAQVARIYTGWEQQMKVSLAQQGQPIEAQKKVISFIEAPEVRTGFILAGMTLNGAVIFLFAIGGGGFAGMLRSSARSRRPNLRPGA